MLGEYPEMRGMNQKKHYRLYEIDFGRRLIAKFTFKPSAFWGASDDFPMIPRRALYPEHDPMIMLAESVKNDIKRII